MSSTRLWYDSLSVSARFAVVSVLPSLGIALVTITTLIPREHWASCSHAASLLYCSRAMSFSGRSLVYHSIRSVSLALAFGTSGAAGWLRRTATRCSPPVFVGAPSAGASRGVEGGALKSGMRSPRANSADAGSTTEPVRERFTASANRVMFLFFAVQRRRSDAVFRARHRGRRRCTDILGRGVWRGRGAACRN